MITPTHSHTHTFHTPEPRPLIPCCDRADIADRKHHLRVYFMMHSPRGTDRVDFYYYKVSAIAAARGLL